MLQKIPWNDGRHDIRPCSDVDRRDVVRRTSEPALLTFKSISGYSISFGFISTSGAGSGSSSRIHNIDRDTCEGSLVFDKTPQLPECPGMLASTLSLSNRYPISDALQIFEDDHLTGVLGFRYQFLGDDMIGIGGESSLFSGESFEMLLCTPGATFLETTPVFGSFPTNLIDGLSAVGLTVTIYGGVDNPKIDTESTHRFDLFGFGNIDHYTEIECSFDKYEVCLTPDSIHAGFVVVTHDNRYESPSFEGQDGDAVKPFPGQHSLVIDHRPVLFEFWFDIFVSLIDLDDLGDGPDGHLSREAELLPDIIIDNFLECDFVGASFLESFVCNEITCFVEGSHGGLESPELVPIGLEFDLQRQFHYIHHNLQYIFNYRQFLPWLKPVGFLGEGVVRCWISGLSTSPLRAILKLYQDKGE